MQTVNKEVNETEDLIIKIDGLAKLYLSSSKTADKRAIYSRLVSLRIRLSQIQVTDKMTSMAFLGSNLKNNATFLN